MSCIQYSYIYSDIAVYHHTCPVTFPVYLETTIRGLVRGGGGAKHSTKCNWCPHIPVNTHILHLPRSTLKTNPVVGARSHMYNQNSEDGHRP